MGGYPVLGRIAVITGGGSGMGRACALELAARGCRVAILDLDPASAQEVADEITTAGGSALPVTIDVSKAAGWLRAKAEVEAGLGPVDIVLNFAGRLFAGDPLEISRESWIAAFETNFLSVIESARQFGPGMAERGHGYFLSCASTAGLYPYSYDRLPYSTTKAALISGMYALYLYFRERNIGTSLLIPGSVSTKFRSSMHFDGEARKLQVAGMEKVSADQVGKDVVDAIESGTFIIMTHEQASEDFRQLAAGPQAYLENVFDRLGDSIS